MRIVYPYLLSLIVREEGQDLAEYAMVVAVVALGAIWGMRTLAEAVNTEFLTVGTFITDAVTKAIS